MPLTKVRIGFDVLVLVFFVYILLESLEFRSLAGYFPGAVAGFAIVISILNLAADVIRFRRSGTIVAVDQADSATIKEDVGAAERRHMALRMARYVGWMTGFVALIWLVGMVVATPVFLLAFFLFDARTSWAFAILGAIAATGGLILATDVMNLRWPSSLLTLL